MRRALLFAGLALAAMLTASALALRGGWLVLPERFDPWAELDVAAAPSLLTGLKLRRAQRDGPRCMALLGEAGLQFKPVPDRASGAGCGLAHAVRLEGGRELALSTPTLLSCRAALSFALWERHALQPAARAHWGVPVVRLEHLGSYACRDVVTGRADGSSGRRSRHATADALDVAGFVPEGGRLVTVRQAWAPQPGGAPTPEAAFLRDAHRGACDFFDGVLGPDYNAVHADHFHLEVDGSRMCR